MPMIINSDSWVAIIQTMKMILPTPMMIPKRDMKKKKKKARKRRKKILPITP